MTDAHQKIIAETTLLNAEQINELTSCFLDLVENLQLICPEWKSNNRLSSAVEQMQATIEESNKRIQAYRTELFGP